MAIVELEKRGIVKYLISQNCDGLHRKSGIPPSKISELHGNRNLEKCSKCGKEYLRDFDAVASYIFSVHDHRTGRKCAMCNGDLLDSIINFGDNLPTEVLENAWTNSRQSDLCLVIGSSLRVQPACLMPEHVGKNPNANLVICNLQNTPLDKLSSIRIHAHSDNLMKLVMQHLGINVPPFTLHRRVCVNVDTSKSGVHVYAVDLDGTPASICPGVIVNETRLEAEPFVYTFPSGTQSLDVVLFFYGHYNEPSFTIKVPCKQTERHYYDLTYNPMTGEWVGEYKGPNAPFLVSGYKAPSFPDPATAVKPQPTGFSVEPRDDCPHFQTEVGIGVSSKIGPAFHKNICQFCNDGSENWICLTCGDTFCSRYVNGHAKEHSESSGHHIALSFSDLSVWCYLCSEYIKDPFLTTMFVGELYKAKFGE